jgi:phage terminase large subunit-like protein
VGVDPKSGDETVGTCGIIVEGRDAAGHGYTLDDRSSDGGPEVWAAEVLRAFHEWGADAVVVEINQGGAMVKHVLRLTPGGQNVPIKEVWASRGKYLRAEPVANLYGQRRFHHVGTFVKLEDEMCSYVPGAKSPNRLDAKVWASMELFPPVAGPRRPAPPNRSVRTA